MKFSLSSPPEHVCLLRLSALGDITHVLPTLRTLQTHWPDTRITWIIGRSEYALVKEISGVDFIVFDKSRGWREYLNLRKQLKAYLAANNRDRFDILFHMQLSLRASKASLFIPADIRLGFDKARAKDLQSWFCNAQIRPATTRQHVVDSFLEFPAYFDLPRVLQWQLPVTTEAKQSLATKLEAAAPNTGIEQKPLFVIVPCAVAKNKNWRDWTHEGHAMVADFVQSLAGMKVVICGGPSQQEKEAAASIVKLCNSANPINLVGKTSIDEMVALLDRAELVLAPDTGPLHIASALGTKTIGLFAATNPQRAGPYNYMNYVVNRYPEALEKYYQTTVAEARWGKRITTAECMQLITPEAVIEQINAIINENETDE